MTKIQRADALLWAAKWWQNEQGRDERDEVSRSTVDFTEKFLEDIPEIDGYDWEWDLWASAALSEVGALGFDLEDVEVWDRESKTWRKP